MHVLAGEIVGVFAHVERADQHRAGGFEPRDQRRVVRGRRRAAVDLGAGAGRQAGDVEQVLDREGHAGERQVLAVRGPIDGARRGAGALGGDVGEGVERGVARGDLARARAR